MSATTLYQRQGGPIDVAHYPSLSDKTFDKIVKKVEDEPTEGLEWFDEIDTNLSTYKVGEVSSQLDVPIRNTDSDRVPMVSPVEGFPKTFTPVQRRSGFIVTREAIEAQKWRQIGAMLTGLPASFQSLKMLAIANFFSGAFATEEAGDGSYVFANSHKLEDVKFGTWDNLGTAGGITIDSLDEAWQSLMGRVNSKGRPVPDKPTDLIYHYTKHKGVMEIAGSEKTPDNALNAVTPKFIKAWEPHPMVWQSSTTAWFMRGDKDKRDPGFKIVYKARETYLKLSDSLNPDLIMGRRGRVSFAIGCVHSRHWQGNAGA